MLLSELDAGRRNNLDFSRFVAASAVIYAHAFKLLGRDDPLRPFFGVDTGFLAVGVFFCLSGYLISKSLLRRDDLLSFTTARVLRIYPALLVANVITVVWAAGALTTLGVDEFASSSVTWRYLGLNSTLLTVRHELPGVFEDNPYPRAVNGSLWTLPVELRMYGLVLFAGVLAALLGRRTASKRRSRVARVALAVIFSGGYVLGSGIWDWLGLPYRWPVTAGTILLLPYFAAGALFFLLRERVRIDWRIAASLVLVLVLLRGNAAWGALFPAAVAYWSLWIGYGPIINCHGFSRYGDFSYGIYVYAFPVQQSWYALTHWRDPLVNFGVAFGISLVLAVLSWQLVEKRALRQRDALTSRLRRCFSRAAGN